MDSRHIADAVARLTQGKVHVVHQNRPDAILDTMAALIGPKEACRHLGVAYTGPRPTPSKRAKVAQRKKNKAARLSRRRNRR